MRYIFILIFSLFSPPVLGQGWEDQRLFSNGTSSQTLRILSNTDTRFFAPIIESFLATQPSLSIDYLVTGSADLYDIFRTSPAEFDVLISSAMDLQFKLTNDGYALPLNDIVHPNWAQWRKSLFAFSTEPAAIVINRNAFKGILTPKSRQDLIEALRARPETFKDKIGTYDVRQSGLGYFFATQDARSSETYWRLTEVFGSLNARLYCCSGDMIDDLISGRIAVAYNVLGSYALGRIDAQSEIKVILPSNFPTTMMRSALVSRETRFPTAARAFIQHITDIQADGEKAAAFPLPPLDQTAKPLISLGPELMTYLDILKRRTFIQEWESAIIQ
jgi:iron(III) transport system substrate-binding protein